MNDKPKLSIILPAKNEAPALVDLLPSLLDVFPKSEIIVVDDGSTDETRKVCSLLKNTRVVSHAYSMGNGAAVKSGIRAASGDILVLMDADGQHDPSDLRRLLTKLEEGHDMVVGARVSGQASLGRHCANAVYNKIASWMVGHKISDLTSGFRAVRADKIRRFLYLFPNGFSYPTTVTMAFFRAGYSVAYVPIHARKRKGKSHIRPFRDSLRFLLIIFKVATLYSPLKLFIPVSAAFFATGLAYYAYTFATISRFTNMSALLFITSVMTLLIGLISEQIAALNYKDSE